MPEAARSIVVGTAGLSLFAVAALCLTCKRNRIEAETSRLRSAARVAGVAVIVQAAHSAEEFATGFHQRFPELMGLSPWPTGFFVCFNLFWLAIWIWSIRGLLARRVVALFPLWFLGIACVANGLAHPSLAALSGGYFPGLITAPFVAVVGVMLLRRLFTTTAPAEPAIVVADAAAAAAERVDRR